MSPAYDNLANPLFTGVSSDKKQELFLLFGQNDKADTVYCLGFQLLFADVVTDGLRCFVNFHRVVGNSAEAGFVGHGVKLRGILQAANYLGRLLPLSDSPCPKMRLHTMPETEMITSVSALR